LKEGPEGLEAGERESFSSKQTAQDFLNSKDICLQFNGAGVAVSSSKTEERAETIWKKF